MLHTLAPFLCFRHYYCCGWLSAVNLCYYLSSTRHNIHAVGLCVCDVVCVRCARMNSQFSRHGSRLHQVKIKEEKKQTKTAYCTFFRSSMFRTPVRYRRSHWICHGTPKHYDGYNTPGCPINSIDGRPMSQWPAVSTGCCRGHSVAISDPYPLLPGLKKTRT